MHSKGRLLGVPYSFFTVTSPPVFLDTPDNLTKAAKEYSPQKMQIERHSNCATPL
jgi:hypothetical protein